MAHRRELSNDVTMPLLFKTGKLVINDIDQLVFSDDPDSCRCCPGLCECPAGSDFAAPKYIDDLYVVWSNIPNTYSETRNYSITNRLGNGSVAISEQTATLTINGLSGLNGTWAGLLSTSPGGAECVAPDPVPACPYNDSRAGCTWYQQVAIASITGTYEVTRKLDLRAFFPGSTPIDESATYYINGRALAGTNDLVYMWACLSTDAYGTNKVGGFGIFARKTPGGEQMSYQDILGSRLDTREDCTLVRSLSMNLGSGGAPLIPAFPAMMLPITVNTSGDTSCQVYVDTIPSPPSYGAAAPWAICSEVLGSSGTYSLAGCSGSGAESGQTGTIAYDASWSYSISQFDWDYTKTVSILP